MYFPVTIIVTSNGRYLEMTGADMIEKGTPLEIHIATDDNKKTFTIQVSQKFQILIGLWTCIMVYEGMPLPAICAAEITT